MNNVSGKTKVLGIFGYPVEHSFSPSMHNKAFAAMGMDCVYVPFPVRPKRLASAVEAIRALDLLGVNVTIPHKTAVMEFLDELAPEAKLIGAVNTVVNSGGVLKGYNTDAPGFIRSLEADAGVSPRGRRVLIAGAGGAARAVSVQLALSGAAEIIFTTPVPKEVAGIREVIADASETEVREVPWEEKEIGAALSGVEIVINATPLGMHPDIGQVPPVPVEALPGGALVCDLIYNPGETLLLTRARERGLSTLNGIGMLLYQGAIAFELWTGVEAPAQVMRKALEEVLNQG